MHAGVTPAEHLEMSLGSVVRRYFLEPFLCCSLWRRRCFDLWPLKGLGKCWMIGETKSIASRKWEGKEYCSQPLAMMLDDES